MHRNCPLPVAYQAAQLRDYWPGCRVEIGRENRNRRSTPYLKARGKLSATSITGEYDVRIEFRENGNPQVFVEQPRLARRPSEPGTAIPHTYDSNKPGRERPCIYLPGTDWDATMSISKTIIPWFRCWLLDYELWQATGTWSGGGVDHSTTKAEDTAR